MPGEVRLDVISGNIQGKSFVYDEHDTFLFGRVPDCHAWIRNDSKVSRHHFILEVNPPDARVRDLGSMNGTYVNGVKHGGRRKGETPEEAAQRRFPQVALKHGDEIRVGGSTILVSMELPPVCNECGEPIPEIDLNDRTWVAGCYICKTCESRLVSAGKKGTQPQPPACQKCGLDVSAEIGDGRRGDYVCEACRLEVRDDPEAAAGVFSREGDATGGAKEGYSEAGPKVEGYHLSRKLGLGSYGAVYLGRRNEDDAEVAVKVMLAQVAVDRKARDRFQQEITLMKGLRHENLVTLLDHGNAGSVFYFIMEYCNGGNLRSLMDRHGGRVPLKVAGPIMLQALSGLACAHDHGVVHRDLKPSNVLLTEVDGQYTAKISDMGLAKNFGQAGLSGMTITGSAGGTPLYMPREQLTNFKYVKPVSDLWSMGATFYHVLTGKGPRVFPKDRDAVDVVLNEDVTPMRTADPDVPKKVAKVIDRSLAVNVKDRYQNAREMSEALAKAL
jgi:serine/threonine-protein kinase